MSPTCVRKQAGNQSATSFAQSKKTESIMSVVIILLIMRALNICQLVISTGGRRWGGQALPGEGTSHTLLRLVTVFWN